MASLYIDQIVWVVKITLSKKDGSGTATYYLGHDYYDEGELYSGSPVIYPILAGGIDSMSIERSVGREIAILSQPSILLYGKGCLDDHQKSFFDLSEEYNFKEAAVEFRQYYKSFDGTTTHSDAANIKLGGCRVKSVQWQGDVLELGCSQVLFKDKEISKRLTEEVFPNMPNDNFYGEYGAIVFGQDVVISTPWLSSDAIVLSTGTTASVFTGWVATDHPMKNFIQLYARNNEGPSDAEWVPINVVSGGTKFHGNQYETGLGDADQAVGESRAVVYSPGPGTGELFYAVNLVISRNTGVTSVDGQYIVRISRAPSYSTAGVFVDEQVLREIKLDIPNTGSLFTYVALLYPPLIATENENYLVEGFWSNPTAGEYYRLRYLTTGTNANDNGQKRDNSVRGAGWETTSNDHYLALYGLQSSGWDNSNGTAPNLYSYYPFSIQPFNVLVPSRKSDNSDGKMHYNVDLKAMVDGLQDTASGTYTGVANAQIENPADIIRFLLLEDEIGLNHGSGNLDSTGFGTARTKAASDLLFMAFAIESETYATGIIPKILQQARLVMPLLSSGQVSLHYPMNVDATKDHYFRQHELRDDMTLVALSESSEDAIINDFLIPFAEDKLNAPRDPQVIRKIRGSSYKEVEYLNDAESSIGDASRVAKAAASIAMYGRRLYRGVLDLYGAGSAAPAKIMKYLFDRWHVKTTTVAVRVPAYEFRDCDLFDDCYLSHMQLPATGGTSNRVRSHDDGSAVLWYYNGVPTNLVAHGSHTGQVQGIRHVGDEIEFIVESVNPFEEA